ncbi:MAG: energy transducer TonB [Candidatus Acidiferrales bacterium]|jgi:protein TonB
MRSKAARFFAFATIMAVLSAAVPVIAGSPPEGASPQTVRVGGDVKPPQKVKDVKAVYPPIAVQNHIQGVVIIDATIGTDGKVKETKVIRAPALQDLTDAAVAAVRGWEFKPTVIDGHPVQVIMTIPINFVL